jgi:hypothetical protein
MPNTSLTGGGSAAGGTAGGAMGGGTAGGAMGGGTAGGAMGGGTAGGAMGGGAAGGAMGGGAAGGAMGGGAAGGAMGGGTAGGATAGGSAGGAGGGSSFCAGTLSQCSSMCVDTLADPENCGSCGRVCGNGEVCNRGTCQVLPMDCTMGAGCGPGFFCDPVSRRCMTGCRLSTDCPAGGSCMAGQCRCPTGQHACGQQCVADTSVASCGTSCVACPTAANGMATCNGTACGLTCDPGYARNGNTCVDVNECLSGNGGCSPNAACTNTPGSRTCACNAGFTGDGVTCADVNECLTNNGGCDANAACTNTPGSRTCACTAGYAGNGLSCMDVDECLVGNGGCSANAACTNTVGSRTCACNAGYVGDGLTCADVNECLSNNGGCSANAACTNTPGSRTCTCLSGYTGDGLTCADVNECLVSNGGCSPNAACTNTPGSRTCTCNAGFTGTGVTCTDVNECLVGNGGCAANATCTNTTGSRTCACNAGFTGDGLTCTDVNECLSGNGGCAANATCANTPGSRTCTCNAGFIGDGLTCVPRPGGETCELATLMTNGQTLNSSTVDTTSNYSGFGVNSVCEVANRSDVVFTANVPPGTRGRFSVTGGMSVDLVTGPAATCNLSPRVCWSGGTASNPAVSFFNGQATAQAVYAIVGAFTPGPFSITYQQSTPTADDTCSTAVSTLTSGQTLVNQGLAGFQFDYECFLSSGNQAGADRVYRATVPALSRLVSTATGSGFTARVVTIDGPASACDSPARQCRRVSSGSSVARVLNLSMSPRESFVVVANDSAATGTFSMSTTVTPIPADDVCSTATTVLTPGMPLTNQTLTGFEQDYTCTTATADRVYLATIPAQSILEVTMTPPAGMAPRLSAIGGPATACESAAPTCLATGPLAAAGSATTIRVANPSLTATDVFVVAAAASGATAGTFSLSATVTPIAAGDVCETAPPLMPGTLPLESIVGFSPSYDISFSRPGCTSTFGDEDRVYVATVPNGQRLTVTVDSMADLILNFIPGPAASCSNSTVACLASADAVFTGGIETATWLNTTGATATVFVVVTSYQGNTSTWSMTTTIQ